MRHIFIACAIPALLLMSGCGPSAEQIATTTASAWTATPPPPTATPTATPVPYDLTALVLDEDGAPIPGASIIFPESGSDETVQADEAGQYRWTNLPGPDATLHVSAPGYLPAERSGTVDRGPSELPVVLPRDPAGLLPSDACAPDEKLLYVEDFQDGEAQGWNEIDLRVPGWDIIPAPDDAENQIVAAQYSDMSSGDVLGSTLYDHIYENAVWRTHFEVSKAFPRQDTWFSFNWLHAQQPFDLDGQQIFDSRYQLPVGYNYFALRRLQQPVTNIGIGQTKNPKFGEWHLAEISTFDGTTEAWMDGKRLMSYNDPKPIPPGEISLELWLQGTDVVVYFDNMSVCELSAPFATSLYQAPVE